MQYLVRDWAFDAKRLASCAEEPTATDWGFTGLPRRSPQ